jgi:transposase
LQEDADFRNPYITFSKEQKVQKKVAMVTLGEFANLSKKQVAISFGYATRKSYYDARNIVLNGKTEDLIPKRTGPQRPTKRTRELEKRVIQMRFDTSYNMYEITNELQEEGFDVSSRLVGQILADFGLSKKKRKI